MSVHVKCFRIEVGGANFNIMFFSLSIYRINTRMFHYILRKVSTSSNDMAVSSVTVQA